MHEATLPLAAGETLRLRVFLDRSSVEVFAQDGRVVLTDRVYADARQARLFGFIAATTCFAASRSIRTNDAGRGGSRVLTLRAGRTQNPLPAHTGVGAAGRSAREEVPP